MERHCKKSFSFFVILLLISSVLSGLQIMISPVYGDDLIEPYVYTYFEAPSNSFGFSNGTLKSVNFSYFWSFFENHSCGISSDENNFIIFIKRTSFFYEQI